MVSTIPIPVSESGAIYLSGYETFGVDFFHAGSLVFLFQI